MVKNGGREVAQRRTAPALAVGLAVVVGLGPLGGGGSFGWGLADCLLPYCFFGCGPGLAFLAGSVFCGSSSDRLTAGLAVGLGAGFAVGFAAGLLTEGRGSVRPNETLGLGTDFLGATMGSLDFLAGGTGFFATLARGFADGEALGDGFFAASFAGFGDELSATAASLGLGGA